MKVVLLAAASSIHTIRWANGLAEAGLDVHVITQHPQLEAMHNKVKIHILPFRGIVGYFTMVPAVKRILKELQPDILNAHYASGYATTAHLVGYHPWILSVWGSDIYVFPHKSPLHKILVRKNLLAADRIASTSICMAEESKLLVPSLTDIAITPFGIDTDKFKNTKNLVCSKSNSITIGTIKSLKEVYGIDTLLNAFSILYYSLSKTDINLAKKLRLRIVGDGPEAESLKKISHKLKIDHITDFVGPVPHTQVPTELENIDIFVALSRSESFGVAVIEASAAGKPVIVSNVGGLPEVVIKDKTGLIVPKDDADAAANAISELVLNKHLRVTMGKAGTKHVAQTYDWDVCVATMIHLYKETTNNYKSKK